MRLPALFGLVLLPPAAAGGPLQVSEGDWLLYKGTLKASRKSAGESSENLSASLEVAYLGLGPAAGASGGREALLVRSAESQDDASIAASEAVSLVLGSDLAARPVHPIEDRASRVSPLFFNHLPLGLFPALGDAAQREWTAPARLHVLFHEPKEVAASHRIEAPDLAGAVRYTVEAKGQKVSFLRDRTEVPFEIAALKQAWTLSPSKGQLLRFESRLEGKLLGDEDAAVLVQVEIDLALSQPQRVEGGRWAKLKAEARSLQEIEAALFADFNVERAQAKAQAFEKEASGSRLARFAAGLARQADDVAPIAQERRLYGKPAPDFTLRDLEGKEVTFSKILPGKITLLSFWSVG